MEIKNIALIIKTDGLEYDDRVRKEILTVQKLYPNIKFKIYAMLPKNEETEGVTNYGIPYKSVFITAREKYPSASKTTLKAWQFYKAVKCEMQNFDAVWVANVDAAFIPILLHHKCILWDLHELPLMFMRNWPLRQLLRYAFNRCTVVLHANPQRTEYLESIGVISNRNKHFAVRNYPNFEDEDKEYDNMYNAFIEWKGGRRCVYLQGLNFDRRAPFESISAVMAFPELCAVVVGGFDAKIKKILEMKFGGKLQQSVWFVGKIPQLKIPQYIKQCYTSLIFYKNVNPNNYYCEANRFYQSVIMGLPVIVGSNPPMKELVDRYGFGVAIDDDGSNIEKICDGIISVLSNYDEYHEKNIKYRYLLTWDSQEKVFRNIIENLGII